MSVLNSVLAGLNVVNLLGGVALGVIFGPAIKSILGYVLAKVGVKIG